MTGEPIDVGAVQEFLKEFAEDRDWVRYHTPKNLAMALTVEAGELLEIFQWMTPEESALLDEAPVRSAVADELADILQYLIRLADVLDIDISEALMDKLQRNKDRFPISERQLDGIPLARRRHFGLDDEGE